MEPNPSMTQTSRGDADTPPNPKKPGTLTNDFSDLSQRQNYKEDTG